MIYSISKGQPGKPGEFGSDEKNENVESLQEEEEEKREEEWKHQGKSIEEDVHESHVKWDEYLPVRISYGFIIVVEDFVPMVC